MRKGKPKYIFNHLVLKAEDGTYGVYERLRKVPLVAECYGTPLALGKTQDEAVQNAVKLGIKRYDIKRVKE